MKRLAMGVMLTSLLFFVVAFTAAAQPFYEEPNVLWSATVDGTSGYLLVVNTEEGMSYGTIVLQAYTSVSIVDDESVIYVDGAIAATGISDYVGQLTDTIYVINLPVPLGYMDFAIVKLTAENDQFIKLYDVELQ
jgi:hypothetical protein